MQRPLLYERTKPPSWASHLIELRNSKRLRRFVNEERSFPVPRNTS